MQNPDNHNKNGAQASAVRDEQITAFKAGVRALAPATPAIAVWGMVTGLAMVKVGLSQTLALVMTLLVYAGSAQLTALPLIMVGAPLWLIFAASVVVNLRFVIFSAAFYPFFRHYSVLKRLVLGYFSGDLSFVVFIPRYAEAPVKGTREQTWFFWGISITNWVVWQVASILGIFLGAVIPTEWSLEFAAVLALMAIVVPMATTRPMLASIAAAGVVAWVAQPLPLRLGLVVAVVVGVVAGIAVERAQERKHAQIGGKA
jgi:predicted branched-subunit amino acid permease